MVSGERREKALSYRFPKDRAMSLAAGLLLRYAGESAFCSIAHTWSRVVLATSGEKIGCDVEPKNRPANLAAAKRFFHPAEAEYLSAHPEDFLRIWTQKESYYKCNNAPFSQFNTLEMRFFAPDLSDGYVYCVYSAKKDAEIPRLHDLRNDFSLWAAAPARGK